MLMEEVDQHLDNSENEVATKDGATGLDLCTAYKAVRPVLEFAKLLLFFKPKWQIVLANFILVNDSLCNK